MSRTGWLTLLLLAGPLAAAEAPPGFFPDSVESHLAAEEVLLATPAPMKARKWLAALTEEPHVAGTPQEKAVADYVRQRLEDFGLATEVAEYQVFLNHPEEVSLRLIAPEEIELSLMEEPIEGDKDSLDEDMFPGFHGYGASGTARGEVVYANYGTPADFERLAALGVEVEGRIVLARYGQVFRGLKVREAEKRGAAGVILYSDPADDGYHRGDVYPDGPMRPPSAIQRGSVQFLSIQPGDPSTPGYPSRDGAARLERAEMKTVPRIPSLPISYGEAEKILRRLGGDNVPEGWQGGLPFAYHLGPGGAAVEMSVSMDEGLKAIYNVFGRIEGAEEPERLVILGNHRDAWTHGAVDPSSGTAAWLETARALAAAVESGWRPRRTILLASWDAEEYGLVGSVEWGEDRADDLGAHAVAYVNLDSAVTGPRLGVAGVPSLRDLTRAAAARIDDPLSEGTVGDGWERRLHDGWAESTPVELAGPEPEFELQLGALGSGSDYTVFIDHLGVPSMSFGFSGSYGVYHSIYDNFRWMEKFGDPQFVYHAAAARFYGVLAMRLAGAEVVPLRFGNYGAALRGHLDDLRRRVRKAARKPRLDGDETEALAPDFAAVMAALERFTAAGRAADEAVDAITGRGDTAAAARVNPVLMGVERVFLDADGLPGRPWFRHLIWAPGLTTGYAPWPFPELAEAVENEDAELFASGAERAARALDRATAELEAVVRQAAAP